MVIDADVIIRYLVSDDETKAGRFERFLSSGKRVRLTDVTFAEIYWTLRSFYKLEKKRILKVLRILISHKSIMCSEMILERCLEVLNRSNVSLIDAYIAVWAKEKEDGIVMSFDRELDKLEWVKRVEP